METDQGEEMTSAGCQSEDKNGSTTVEQITSEATAELNKMPQELYGFAKSPQFPESELQERRSFQVQDASITASTDTFLSPNGTVCFDEQQLGHLQKTDNLAEPIPQDSINKSGHPRDERLVVLTDAFDAADAALRAMEEEISEKTKDLSVQKSSIEHNDDNENPSEEATGFSDECATEYDANNADSLETVLKTDQIVAEEVTRRAQEEFEAKNKRTGRTYPMPTQNILDEVVYFQDSTTTNPETTAQQEATEIEKHYTDIAENEQLNNRSEEISESATMQTHKGEASLANASEEQAHTNIHLTEEVSVQNDPQENAGNRSTILTEMDATNKRQPYKMAATASQSENGMNLHDKDAPIQEEQTFSSTTKIPEERSELEEEQLRVDRADKQAGIIGTQSEGEHDNLPFCQPTTNRCNFDGGSHFTTDFIEPEQADSAVAEAAIKSEAKMSFVDEASKNTTVLPNRTGTNGLNSDSVGTAENERSKNSRLGIEHLSDFDVPFEKPTMQMQPPFQNAISKEKSNGKVILEDEHEMPSNNISNENIETLFDSYLADHERVKMIVATLREKHFEKGVGEDPLIGDGQHSIEYGEQPSCALQKSAELELTTPASELAMHSTPSVLDEVNHLSEEQPVPFAGEGGRRHEHERTTSPQPTAEYSAIPHEQPLPYQEEGDEQLRHDQPTFSQPTAEQDIIPHERPLPYQEEGDKQLRHEPPTSLQPTAEQDIMPQEQPPPHAEQLTLPQATIQQDIIPPEQPLPYQEEGDEQLKHDQEGDEQLRHDQPIFSQPTAQQDTIPHEQPLPYQEEGDEQLRDDQQTFSQPTAEQDTIPHEQPLPYQEEGDEQFRHDQPTFSQPTAGQDIIPYEEPLPYQEEADEQLRHEPPTLPQATAEQDTIPHEQPLPYPEEGDEQLRHELPTFPQATAEQDIIPHEQPLPYPEEEDEQLRHEPPTFSQPTAEQDTIPHEQPLPYPEEGNEQRRHEPPTFSQPTAEQDTIPHEQPLSYPEEGDEQLRHEPPTFSQPTAEQDTIPHEQPLPYPEEGDEQRRHEPPTFSQPTAEQDTIPHEQPLSYPEEGDEQLRHEPPTFSQPTAEQDTIPHEQPLPYQEEGDEQLRDDQQTFSQPTAEQDTIPYEQPLSYPEEGDEQLRHEPPTFSQPTAEQDTIPHEQPLPYPEEGDEQRRHEPPTFSQPTAEQDTLPHEQPLPYQEEGDEQLRDDQQTFSQPTAEQDTIPYEQPLSYPEEGDEQLGHKPPTFPQATAEQDTIPYEQPLSYPEEGDEQLGHKPPTLPQATAEQDTIPHEQPLPYPEERDEQLRHEPPTFPQATAEQDTIPYEQPLSYLEEGDEQLGHKPPTLPQATAEQDTIPHEQPLSYPEEGDEQLGHKPPTLPQATAEQDTIPHEQPLPYPEEGDEQLRHELPTFPQATAEQDTIPHEQPLPYPEEGDEQLRHELPTFSQPTAVQDTIPYEQPLSYPEEGDEQLGHKPPTFPQATAEQDTIPYEQPLPYPEEGDEQLRHNQSAFSQPTGDEQHGHQDEGGDDDTKRLDVVSQKQPMDYRGEEEMEAIHDVAQTAQQRVEEHVELDGHNKSDEPESEQRSFRLSYLSSIEPNVNANILWRENDAFAMNERELLFEVEKNGRTGEDPSARNQWRYDSHKKVEGSDSEKEHFEQWASEFGEDRSAEKSAPAISQAEPAEEGHPSPHLQSQLETTGDPSDIKAAGGDVTEQVVEEKRDITPDSLDQSPHFNVRKRTDVVETAKDMNKLREHIPSRREKSDISGAHGRTGVRQLITNKKQNERATTGAALSKTRDEKKKLPDSVRKQQATVIRNKAASSKPYSERSPHKAEKPLSKSSLEKVPISKLRQSVPENGKRTSTAPVRTSVKPPVPRKPGEKGGSVEKKGWKESFKPGMGGLETKAEKVGEGKCDTGCNSVKKTSVKVSICEPIVWVETLVPTFEAMWVASIPQDEDIVNVMKKLDECIDAATGSKAIGGETAHIEKTPESAQKTPGNLHAVINEAISQEEMKFSAMPETSELAVDHIGEDDVLIAFSKKTAEVSEEPSSSQYDVTSALESKRETTEDSGRILSKSLEIKPDEEGENSEGTFSMDNTFPSPKASHHNEALLEAISKMTSSHSEAPFKSPLTGTPSHNETALEPASTETPLQNEAILESTLTMNDSTCSSQLKEFQSDTAINVPHSAVVDRFIEQHSEQNLLAEVTASNESASQDTLSEKVNGNLETALSEHYLEKVTSTHNHCSDEEISHSRSSDADVALNVKEDDIVMNTIAAATEEEQVQNEQQKEAADNERPEEKPSRPRQHGRGQFRGTMMCEQEGWKQSSGRQDNKQKQQQALEGDGYVNHGQQSSQHKSKKRSRRSGKGHK